MTTRKKKKKTEGDFIEMVHVGSRRFDMTREDYRKFILNSLSSLRERIEAVIHETGTTCFYGNYNGQRINAEYVIGAIADAVADDKTAVCMLGFGEWMHTVDTMRTGQRFWADCTRVFRIRVSLSSLWEDPEIRIEMHEMPLDSGRHGMGAIAFTRWGATKVVG